MWVYVITFDNGKRYVGVSSQPEHRMYEHEHGPWLVGRAMRKHAWSYELVFEGSEQECFAKEQDLITSLGTVAPGGYNLTDGGEGAKLSPDLLRKRGEAIRLGWTAESRAKCSERQQKQWTPELREAARLRGLEQAKRQWTPEAREAARQRTLKQHQARRAL